jgi:hypothetical protein
MASTIGTTPVPGVGTSFIPDLTDSANIQSALKLLYYGTTQTATTNGIYGSLASLQTQISATQAGINVHENVKAATLLGTPIPGVYAAGTTDLSGGTGIGAKITYSATGVVTIDGVTLALNDRILVKDGTTALSGTNSVANGIYYVSTLGAVGVACVLTRATDSDNSIQGEFAEGDFVFVSGGTTPNNNTSWVLTSSSHTGTGPAGSIKIGTDPVTYLQFGAITWGSQTANTFFAAPAASSGTPTFRGIDYRDMSTLGSPSTSGQVLRYAPAGNGIAWSTEVPVYPGTTPTFTVQVNLAAGTTSIVPLDFNTTGALLTTPAVGSVEAVADGLYYTNNPGTTSTGPGRGIITAPHMVFSLASSSTSASTTPVNIFAAANDVLSVLEPAKLYRFRAKYFHANTYGGSSFNVAINFAFSNAPTAIKYTFKSYPATASTSVNYVGQSAVTTATSVVQVASGSGYFTEVDGYFTTHATLTSTLTPQFACASTPGGGGNAVMAAGSWIEIEKLGTSTQTLIAGNWA